MADITSKHAPRDPSEGLTNQGVATQGMINYMAREQTYQLNKRLNKKSTWDKVMGGIGDVINIGKGVMDIANSYEDLQVKEEQIKASELNRQSVALNIQQRKQNMNLQSIQNDMALKQLQKDNSFLDTFNDYVKANDFDGAIKTALENPRQAKQFQALLLNTANQLEKNGDTDRADALRLSAASGDRVTMANLMYGSQQDPNRVKANPTKYKTYQEYSANVQALTPILASADNSTKLSKLGLNPNSSSFANDLLTCSTRIGTTNTVNENNDKKEYLKSAGIKLADIDNLGTSTSNSSKNVQLLDITCNVDGVPHTEQFAINANDKVRVNTYNAKGMVSGQVTVPLSTAVSSLITNHMAYKANINEPKFGTPVTAAIEEKAASMHPATYAEGVSPDVVEREARALDNKDYAAYNTGVANEIRNLPKKIKNEYQQLNAIIADKVKTMAQDPVVLNNFIIGPLNYLAEHMSPVEQKALQAYSPDMGIPMKKAIAAVYLHGVGNGLSIDKILDNMKERLENSTLYQEKLREQKKYPYTKDGVTYHSPGSFSFESEVQPDSKVYPYTKDGVTYHSPRSISF